VGCTQCRATGADLAHLRARANGISIENVRHSDSSAATTISASNVSGDQLLVTYSNGWSEEIVGGFYILTDQYGRMAVTRPSTKLDVKRLRQVAEN